MAGFVFGVLIIVDAPVIADIDCRAELIRPIEVVICIHGRMNSTLRVIEGIHVDKVD